MNILYVFSDDKDEWNSSEWRCAIPVRAINKTANHHAEMISINDFILEKGREKLEWANILVIQRLAVGNCVPEMIYWKAHGKTVVVDLDDAYNLMAPDNQSYSFWIEGKLYSKKKPTARPMGDKDKKEEETKVIFLKETPYQNLQWAVKLIDGITSPSKVILDDWKDYCKTYWVPNYLELETYSAAAPNSVDGTINVGWMGSHSHFRSFQDSGVLYALKRLVDTYPHVNIILGGGDTRIYDAIKVNESRKSMAKWVPFKDYPSLLQQLDIGVAPLFAEYDNRRSWIKVAEYIAMGKVWVASNKPPYQIFSEYGTLVRNTTQDWYKALSYCVENYATLSTQALSNMKLALTFSIENNTEQLIAIYQRIIDEAQ
jgi:glycosyltransferase involved in cell wall biosynthesis